MAVNPSTINHRPSTRRWIPVILIVVGIAALVLWPRPTLFRYTSPPLDSKGTKIRLLVPQGWYVEDPEIGNGGVLRFKAATPMAWLPSWARRALQINEEMGGMLVLIWRPIPLSESEVTVADSIAVDSPKGRSGVTRTRHIRGRGDWSAIYFRGDEGLFRATYKTILDSVTVL